MFYFFCSVLRSILKTCLRTISFPKPWTESVAVRCHRFAIMLLTSTITTFITHALKSLCMDAYNMYVCLMFAYVQLYLPACFSPVYFCTCVCVCVCVCVYLCVFTCANLPVGIFLFAFSFSYFHMYIRTYVSRYVCMYVCTYMCVCVYICKRIGERWGKP